MLKLLCSALALGLLLAHVCPAQEPLKIEQAIELAQSNYPALRAAQAQKQAAEAGVEVARTALLPRTELIWQENRATRNNVFGLLLPQTVIPPISGPVQDTTTATSAWGSAAGLLFSWEPFDFGLRNAGIELARALGKQAQAQEAVSQFDISINAADAFLTAVAAAQTVRAAQANVDRQEAFFKAVQALVENQLRPGVDASRSSAEFVAAQNQLIQAEQNAELARIALSETIGRPGAIARLDPGPMLEYLPNAPPQVTNTFATHPLALAQTAALDVVKARQQTLDKSFYPHFSLQSAVFARGSSALLNGQFDQSKGWYPDTANWAAGITITFAVSDWFSLKAKRRVEMFNLQAEQARYELVQNTLKTQEARARTLIATARRIAANTPKQVNAANETLTRAKVRYEHGLTNITEVAEAQRLLAQAEIDDSLARLSVWRALLAAAKLQGDLKPFLEQVASVAAEQRK